MTGGQMMVVLIVAIVMIASIVKSKHGSRHRQLHDDQDVHRFETGETQQLRQEVKQLKERLAVLERITVEKENSLEREIEKLRDPR
jgi:uncharacterized protein YlxW (UPF0749 family)